MFKKISPLVLGALLVSSTVTSNLADAAVYTKSKTQSFDVTMKVVADCVISVANLDFGQNQGLLTNGVNATGNMSVTCSNTTPYNIGLNEGTGIGSTGTTRYLNGSAGNPETIKFNLYQDNSKTLWGNAQGVDTKSGTGTGIAQTISIFGEVPAQNTPKPDDYKSTITATIYF